MKRGLKQKSYIFLVMALVFFTGKAALAESPFQQCNTEVEGAICSIDTVDSSITLCEYNSYSDDQVTVYGIPFYYLLRVHELDLEAVEDEVTFLVHVCPTAQPDEKLKACVIIIGEVEITVFPPSEREDRVSADVNGNRGNYGQGRF